jgi:heme-degrading monooxygenase HmoA
VIARVWRGRTAKTLAEEYTAFLEKTGLKDYRATSGNRGVRMLRRIDGETAEFLLISLWDSFDAIARFAGEDVERAFYYPEDDRFLLEKEPRVTHYEVISGEEEVSR